jgi:DNA modification methylase
MGDPNTTFAPKHERIIHAVQGSPVIYSRLADVIECARVDTKNHPTEKPVEIMEKYIEAVTVEGDLVADPFAGVASTLVAAKSIGREFWGCEIDYNYHEIGNRRLYG